MSIARGGGGIVVGGAAVWLLLVGLALWQRGWWTAPAAVWTPVALWLPWFFRDPERRGPRDPTLIIAPADGKVVAVDRVDEPTFLGGGALRISIFMNIFDVHVNRHPVSGTVRSREYRPGGFGNAVRAEASERNERMSVGIDTEHGRVLVRQIAGLLARRIVTDVHVGDAVRQGDRLGMIRFGSRVDTFLPVGAVAAVRPGTRTRAGTTVLARWSA